MSESVTSSKTVELTQEEIDWIVPRLAYRSTDLAGTIDTLSRRDYPRSPHSEIALASAYSESDIVHQLYKKLTQ